MLMKTVLFILLSLQVLFAGELQRPLMKDFIGLNGHFHFRPELYSQTCRLARNYHNINWDVKKPGDAITFPVCVNKVNWVRDVYGKWAQHDFEISLCAQFGTFGPGNTSYLDLWRGQEAWIQQYGQEMASHFGPSGELGWVTSIEIGNEPGNRFDDDLFKRLFVNMARGIRKGDPKIKIVTPAVQSGEPDAYSKSLQKSFSSPEILPLYDVINLHTYAVKPKEKGKSPWARSYPEDPNIRYLKVVDEAIAFRNQTAPGKEIWITEFGYDACTPEAMSTRTGWAKKLNWEGVTDLQQAQYLVRSLFCFAERDVDRAYIYFFNDKDQPSVHASSGLTRNFEPKPAFWAVKQVYELLGDMRFRRVIQKKEGELCIYEFEHGEHSGRIIWAVWSPTSNGRSADIQVENLPGTFRNSETMSRTEAGSQPAKVQEVIPGVLSLNVSESPVYLHFRVGESE